MQLVSETPDQRAAREELERQARLVYLAERVQRENQARQARQEHRAVLVHLESLDPLEQVWRERQARQAKQEPPAQLQVQPGLLGLLDRLARRVGRVPDPL